MVRVLWRSSVTAPGLGMASVVPSFDAAQPDGALAVAAADELGTPRGKTVMVLSRSSTDATGLGGAAVRPGPAFGEAEVDVVGTLGAGVTLGTPRGKTVSVLSLSSAAADGLRVLRPAPPFGDAQSAVGAAFAVMPLERGGRKEVPAPGKKPADLPREGTRSRVS